MKKPLRSLPVGSRSLLFGAHQFVLHPLFVALAWTKLFGFPRDPRLWMAFLVHDWGYWGKPNMDGPQGQFHPLYGAVLMGAWFDPPDEPAIDGEWFRLTAGHSRTFSRLIFIEPSRLMPADKLATVLMPFPLYVGLAWLSGEWREYLALHQAHGYDGPPTLLGWARHLRRHWHDNYAPKQADDAFPGLPQLPARTWRQRLDQFAYLCRFWSPVWSWRCVYVEDRHAGFTRKRAFLAWLEFGFRPYWRCLRHGR